MEPIPVTIIAGSFACGKTTLCNELLDTVAPERHMAVISHRFAEEYACQPVVVDESRCGLLEEVYDYGSGCLCCTPGGELNQRLNNMLMWGERYDHVLIRTGPAADPLLFADAVQRSSAYRITGLVTVVDSGMLCFAEQLLFGASLEQLRAADLVLLRVSKVGEDLEALMYRLHELLGKQDIHVPIHVWNTPINKSDSASLLHCRPDGREYMCKPSSLVPNLLGNLGSIHDTNFKAIQMVETGTVDLQLAQKWTANLLSQGFCARMKALLPVEIETGLFTLLVNATRGQMMEQRLVALPPAQVLMGDLKMLVGNIGQLDGVDPEKPMCRIFLLLGPPVAKGLGDMEDLLESMPSSIDLAESFSSVLSN